MGAFVQPVHAIEFVGLRQDIPGGEGFSTDKSRKELQVHIKGPRQKLIRNRGSMNGQGFDEWEGGPHLLTVYCASESTQLFSV
jgi:hypothetical protein